MCADKLDAEVVVVGAGAAGLAAARSLARRALRVVLLEARDRVGGRVWSVPLPGTAVPAELGAEFIHGRAEQTRRLLHEAGLEAAEMDGEGWRCAGDGRLRRESMDFSSVAGILEAACELPEDESVDGFLRRWATDETKREAADAVRAFVEGFDAADPAVASVRSLAEEWRSGTDGAAGRPLTAYGPMFDYLRDACVAADVQLRLSTAARRIAWRRGVVAVDTTCRGEARAVRARAGIVTLPVGVLCHRGDETAVAFEPRLPPGKAEALRYIQMGHVVKVTLRFRTPFWERVQQGRYRHARFFRCEGHALPTYWTRLPVRTELVVAWVGGPKAIGLEGAPERERIALALRGFGALLGEPGLARREFQDGVTHNWGADPFARGAYSYVAVGGGDPRAALAAPVDDTLFFAGEATSTDGQGGTVNGALETGERAAAEAAAALGASSRRP